MTRTWQGLFGVLTALALSAGCHSDNNNVTGPSPAPVGTPVAGTPIPTARPIQTPTPAPSGQTASVNVGAGNGFAFVDQQSGSSTTSIHVGDTVKWTWVSGPHSTTSGSCGGGGCQPSGTWDSGISSSGATFSNKFMQAGSFPYYCRVHGAMMQGMVVVQ